MRSMKQQKIIITILTSFLFSPNIGTYPIIRLSLKQLLEPQQILKSLKKSTATAKYTFNGLQKYRPVEGVFATYAGFMTNSDSNGQILLSLKHKTSLFYILVTQSLEPVTMFGNTVHHWELLPGAPAVFFKCELNMSENHKEQFWHIEHAAIPADNIIPLEAIVLIADPRFVTIPTGMSVASKGPNIILPDIYITKGINIVKNAAYMLNIRHLFGNITLNRQKQTKMYQVGIDQ